jgi:hypothetical protein
MKQRYFQSIVLNTVIITTAFIAFIFLDSNVGKASLDKKALHSQRDQIIALPEKETNEQSRLPFNWNPDHYTDLNEINEDTNFVKISLFSNQTQVLAFYPDKKAYYRFEIGHFILKSPLSSKRAFVRVMKDGKFLNSYFGPTNLPFKKNAQTGEWEATWFYGWKIPLGKYQAVLYVDNQSVLQKDFEMIQRKPVTFNKMGTFINLEWNQTIVKRNIYDHTLNKTPFVDGLLDWMDYGDIEGFMTLAGETTGWGNITPEKPWEYYPLKNLELIGKELHERNKMVGAYIMCFYTPQNGWAKAGYESAKGVYASSNNLSVTKSRFASFKDEKRFQDIVKLARILNDLPYVDCIGFDFIRFGELVGYENAEEFVYDMNVPTPDGWGKYSENDKIVWLSQKLRNNSILERWKLWIAHKTADFIYRVRKTAGLTKPIWIFSLGWNHGTEHGQDPYFFQDAGAFADFVMLYEASPDMFEGMKKSWKEYLGKEELNYIPGNQIDAVLSKSIYGNNAVEEYHSRLTTAVDYAPYLSKGVFIHDISRAFWGRKGSHSYLEWLVTGLSSASYARFQNNEIPFKITLPENKIGYKNGQTAKIQILIEFRPEKLSELTNKQLVIESVGNNFGNSFPRKIDISEKTNIILTVRIDPKEGSAQYLALRGKIIGFPSFFTFSYINCYETSKIVKNKQ